MTDTVLFTSIAEIKAWATSTSLRFEEGDFVLAQHEGLWYYFQFQDGLYRLLMTSLRDVFDGWRHNENQV